jgi:hypothetical protein
MLQMPGKLRLQSNYPCSCAISLGVKLDISRQFLSPPPELQFPVFIKRWKFRNMDEEAFV